MTTGQNTPQSTRVNDAAQSAHGDTAQGPARSRPESTAQQGGRRSLTSILTIVSAVLAGEIIWTIAVPVAGTTLEVPQAGMTVGPVAIAVSATVAGLAAWGLRALMGRSLRRLNAWTAVGIVVLVLSLGGPGLSGAIGTVLSVLIIMHVCVGSILIAGLRLAARDTPASRADA